MHLMPSCAWIYLHLPPDPVRTQSLPPASYQILVGNKPDREPDVAEGKRAVPYAMGKALADEYQMQFFETCAKENKNVEEVPGHT